MAHEDSIQDNNQFTALTAHSGTAGTAEVRRVQATDGALHVDLVGTEPVIVQIGTIVVGTITEVQNLAKGTLHTLGTLSKLESGSVRVTHGTITAGTLNNLGTLVGLGSISDIAQVHDAGTVAALPDLPGGTIDQVTEVDNLAKGTITKVEGGTLAEVGTVTGVGSISNVANIHDAGTIAELPDLPGGTVDKITAVDSVAAGTFNTLGTISKIEGTVNVDLVGTEPVVVQIGTIVVGTLTEVGTVPGVGSISDVAQVHNAGTVAALPDLPGGTVDKVTTLDAIAAGTQNTLGTVGKVESGSVRVTVGTITAGTLTNVGTVVGLGSISNVANIHDAGTIAELPDLPGGTVDLISNIGNGTVRVSVGTITAGTLTNVGTVPGIGSVSDIAQLHNAGTLQAGTIQINPKPTTDILTYGTLTSGTAAVYGTLVAAPGSGTSIYINDLSIVNSGTAVLDVMVGFGTALVGTTVLVRGEFAVNGGIEKPYPKATNAGINNAALVFRLGAAGTAGINVSYWTE